MDIKAPKLWVSSVIKGAERIFTAATGVTTAGVQLAAAARPAAAADLLNRLVERLQPALPGYLHAANPVSPSGPRASSADEADDFLRTSAAVTPIIDKSSGGK